MKLPIHWIAIAILWLTYTLLGWHLSAYHFSWLIVAFTLSLILNFYLVKQSKDLGRLFNFGPRSLITIFVLSSLITLAVAASSVFALISILVAAELLARIEMQTAGFRRSLAFGILLTVVTLGLTLGWLFGSLLLPSSRYWIYGLA